MAGDTDETGDIAIDADVRRARTLPAEMYREPRWFRRQVEHVFARSWHAYPDVGVPMTPGDIRPWVLLPGALDEPLVWTRDEQATLRLLSNVCTHRAFVIADRPCSGGSLRCAYHGRRFELDGRMMKAPCFEDAVGFPSRSDDLAAIPFTSFGPLHLVALQPADQPGRLVGPLHQRLSWLPWDRLQIDPEGCREYTISANWALYCDNYLEGLHIPYVHPALNRALDFDRYETQLLPLGALQIGLAPEGSPDVFTPPVGHPDHGRSVAGYYYWLFPTTMINVYPWGISVNIVLPLDVESTRVVYLTYVWDESRRERGAGTALDVVEREDDRAVERVARGVRSRVYTRGRYSPGREQAVHHFHRLLVAAMGDAGAGGGRER